jgi:hypothetical protein
MADAKTDKRPEHSQSDEPAKGGMKQPHQKPYSSGDDEKAEGDKHQHAVDDAAERKSN